MHELSDEMIYAAYPRKVARIAALAAIKRAVLRESKALGEAGARKMIYEAVERFAASPAGNKYVFTPHCATWMNRGSYLDDPSEWWADASSVSREPGIYRGPRMSDEDVELLRRRVM